MGAISGRCGRHCSGSFRQVLATQPQDREPCVALRRRARREATAVGETNEFIEPEFEFEDDTQRALAEAIDSLPCEQREVLVMKIWNELTFAEIAGALGISQHTAASRYRYALTASS